MPIVVASFQFRVSPIDATANGNSDTEMIGATYGHHRQRLRRVPSDDFPPRLRRKLRTYSASSLVALPVELDPLPKRVCALCIESGDTRNGTYGNTEFSRLDSCIALIPKH